MKYKNFFRVMGLLALIVSFLPASLVDALPVSAAPPADMFQLPWDQGIAWVAIDGLDNGTKRPISSSHNFSVGGAIDFAPRSNMAKGEDTSNFWVAAAAAGTVVGRSACHVMIAHANGWITEYQFLGNIQVKLGDSVARNQRLGIIADGVRNKFCPGSIEPNVPHVHFMLRPSLVGASLAGWVVGYTRAVNITTFTKNGQTVGLFKPLLNVFDSTPTPTMTTTPTLLPETPSATPSPTRENSPTPTLSGPYVSTTVDPLSILIGETAQATVRLNNVPAEGYTSAEFTCSFSANLVEVSNIAVTELFGTDSVVAINGPQGNSFIVAVAGSNGSKATTSGTVFTFDVKGLQVGETNLGCEARVSQGNNVLTQIPSARTFLTVLSIEDTPTPNLTPGTPTVLPSACDRAEFIADVNVPPGTVMSPGTTFTKTWRLKNLGPCTWTTSYGLVFFSGEQMGAISSAGFTQSVDVGETVDISINMTAPNAPGSYRGYWMFRNSTGSNFGIGPDANQPWFVDINVSGPTLPPSLTPTPVPSSPTPTTSADTPTATETPGGGPIFTATPTSPMNDWLTFTNSTFGYQFQYPPQGQIRSDSTAGDTIITNLPIVQSGTNLVEKYLEVAAGEPATECKSLFPTQDPGVTVTINGISFLKQTGMEGAAGSLYQWVAYSTLRNGVCVSVNFILHSIAPGASSTPLPPYDYATETAIFDQIIGTYMWLATSTATPTGTIIPAESETPTSTPTFDGFPTPGESPTLTTVPSLSPTPSGSNGAVAGQILANKPVTVNVYDANSILVATMETDVDGTFRLEASPGTYTVVAVSSGFLSAQGSATLTTGNTIILPPITLPAGDIDGNDVIDQFDALTIGMNYNTNVPEAADLNSDGTINVLDLELLAKNYRKTGPVVWE